MASGPVDGTVTGGSHRDAHVEGPGVDEGLAAFEA